MATIDRKTTDLKVGDTVLFGDHPHQILELEDSGFPAIFGKGSEWKITLDRTTHTTQLHTAAGDTWKVVVGQQHLVLTVDVTTLDEQQITQLRAALWAQTEATNDYPDLTVVDDHIAVL